MHFLATILVLSLVLSATTGASAISTLGDLILQPFRGTGSPPIVHVLSLARTSGAPKSSRHLRLLRKGNAVEGNHGSSPLTSVTQGASYLTSIQFGTRTFQAVIDTGSSDTWVVEKGFQCVDAENGTHYFENECGFGELYIKSKTFKQTPNENLNITYADGSFLTGIVGTEQVTLAGITVDSQTVSVVNLAAWEGDGISSGLIGLSFPADTSIYAGTNPTKDTKSIVYNPIFTNMYTEGSVAPIFSIAIERSSSPNATPGGQLALGGVVPVAHKPVFASVPMEITTIPVFLGTPISTYEFYAITNTGFTYFQNDGNFQYANTTLNPFAPPSDPSQVQMIVDSGTTLIYLPTSITDAVNAMFSPPATYDSSSDAYSVDCSGIAPNFGVQIGHQTFYVDAEDLILHNEDGTCLSGVADAGLGSSILGDVFLRNVLAVFDVGAKEMRFAAREYE